MPDETTLRSLESRWPGMAWTLGACAIWAGLAMLNPTTTYHLAPLVALLAWPLVGRTRRMRVGWRPGLIAAAGATAMVAATTLVLLGRDALAGPALIGPDAAVETVSLAALAVGVAIVLARPRPRSSAPLVAHPRSSDQEGVVAGSGGSCCTRELSDSGDADQCNRSPGQVHD